MAVLEALGTGILLILILIFGVFFAMSSVMFIFGLPSLYVEFLKRFGKLLEAKFPEFYLNKYFQGFIAIFLMISVGLVLVGAILLWGAIIEWLPR